MTNTKKSVITFSKRDGSMDMPHLLDIQTAAFQSLLAESFRSFQRFWAATLFNGLMFDVVAVLMEPDRPVTLQHYEAAF